MVKGRIHRFNVHLDNVFAFFTIGFTDGFFDLGDRIIFWQHPRERKETHLHDCIDMLPHSGFAGNFVGVDYINFQLFFDDGCLYGAGQLTPYLFFVVGAINQED